MATASHPVMSSPKTIIHVIESLKTGGAQKLLSDLLPALKKEGLDVRLIVARRENNNLEKKIEDAGIDIVDLGCGTAKSYGFYKLLRGYFRIHSKSILIHAHLFPTLYIAPMAARGLGIPLTYTEHSTSNKRRGNRWLKPIEKFIYSKYSKIIGISEETSRALEKWCGPHIGEKIETIPNGVDLQSFSSIPINKTPNQAIHHKKILMVSRFVAAKDQTTVIRAIPFVKDLTAEFQFAGDGETLEDVRKLAEDMKLTERCRFLGNVEDIQELMHNASIGIQSSHWEGFGLTALEFMASGVPVIASDIPGLGNVVEGAGALFKTGDHLDLADKINQILDNDPEANDIMIERGKKRAADYDIERTAALTKELYMQIIR